jgi:hypothetical protein
VCEALALGLAQSLVLFIVRKETLHSSFTNQQQSRFFTNPATRKFITAFHALAWTRGGDIAEKLNEPDRLVNRISYACAAGSPVVFIQNPY